MSFNARADVGYAHGGACRHAQQQLQHKAQQQQFQAQQQQHHHQQQQQQASKMVLPMTIGGVRAGRSRMMRAVTRAVAAAIFTAFIAAFIAAVGTAVSAAATLAPAPVTAAAMSLNWPCGGVECVECVLVLCFGRGCL